MKIVNWHVEFNGVADEETALKAISSARDALLEAGLLDGSVSGQGRMSTVEGDFSLPWEIPASDPGEE